MAAMAPSMVVPVAGVAFPSVPAGNQSVPRTRSSGLRLSSGSWFGIPSKASTLACELHSWQKRKVYSSRIAAIAAADEVGSAAGAGGDSIVSEVAVLEEEPATPGVASPVATKERKPGVLERGGTLSGKEALGKDPSFATLGNKARSSETVAFEDPRWIKGTWDLTTFTKDGKVNWDSVIDAEVKRRKFLEDNPEASSNNEPVVFETSTIPWWAWVKRFHLPEAELLNGRAAMVGYVAAYLVDSATGVGLVDQQSSFLGKLLLFITIVGVLLVRKTADLDTLRTLAKESTFYDKQWQASWKEDTTQEEKPSE